MKAINLLKFLGIAFQHIADALKGVLPAFKEMREENKKIDQEREKEYADETVDAENLANKTESQSNEQQKGNF